MSEHESSSNTVMPASTTTTSGAYTMGHTTTTCDEKHCDLDHVHNAQASVPTQYSEPNPASGVSVGTAQLGVPHNVGREQNMQHSAEYHAAPVAGGKDIIRDTDNDLKPYPGEKVSDRHIDHHPFGHESTMKYGPVADAHGVAPAADLTTSSDHAVSGNMLPYGVTHTTQGATGTFEPQSHKLASPHEHATTGDSIKDKLKNMLGGGHKLDNPAKPGSSTEYDVDNQGHVVGQSTD